MHSVLLLEFDLFYLISIKYINISYIYNIIWYITSYLVPEFEISVKSCIWQSLLQYAPSNADFYFFLQIHDFTTFGQNLTLAMDN